MSINECGGCKGIGSHRRHCPRHPDYHPFRLLAERAEDIGDSVGVPELANRAWALAGAIRAAIPERPYRRQTPIQPISATLGAETSTGTSATERGPER